MHAYYTNDTNIQYPSPQLTEGLCLFTFTYFNFNTEKQLYFMICRKGIAQERNLKKSISDYVLNKYTYIFFLASVYSIPLQVSFDRLLTKKYK